MFVTPTNTVSAERIFEFGDGVFGAEIAENGTNVAWDTDSDSAGFETA